MVEELASVWHYSVDMSEMRFPVAVTLPGRLGFGFHNDRYSYRQGFQVFVRVGLEESRFRACDEFKWATIQFILAALKSGCLGWSLTDIITETANC